MKIHWLWDTRLNETRVKNILKNSNDPRFYIYAEKLFSRVKNPKVVFKYISKGIFYNQWAQIKQRIEKDKWSTGKVDFWQGYYESLSNMTPERIDIAKQIRNVRIDRGYSQAELAEKLDVIQQYVSKLEAGSENLTIDTLKRIADVLGKKLTIKLN